MERKRILFAVGFLVAIGLMGYGLYVLFFRGPAVPQITQQTGGPSQVGGSGTGKLPEVAGGQGVNVGAGGEALRGLPSQGSSVGAGAAGQQVLNAQGGASQARPSTIAHGGPTLAAPLSLRTALFPALAGGKALFYDQNEGKFYKLDPSTGDIRTLSDRTFSAVENVTWDTAGDKAVLEFPDKSKILVDFTTGAQSTLPKEWNDFSFDPKGQQIAFQYVSPYDSANNWLAVANNDGTNIHTIEPVGDQGSNVAVDWKPSGEIVATYRQSKDLDTQEVVFLGLNDENFKTLPVTGRGFEGKWSNDGSKIVYSVYNDGSQFKPTLWVASGTGDALGQNRKPLDIATWPSKCVFGATTLYCGVPKFLPDYSGVYKQLAQGTPDDIYSIDLTTGVATKLAEPVNRDASPVYSVKDIMVDEAHGSLYFTDASTNQLNEIKLK